MCCKDKLSVSERTIPFAFFLVQNKTKWNNSTTDQSLNYNKGVIHGCSYTNVSRPTHSNLKPTFPPPFFFYTNQHPEQLNSIYMSTETQEVKDWSAIDTAVRCTLTKSQLTAVIPTCCLAWWCEDVSSPSLLLLLLLIAGQWSSEQWSGSSEAWLGRGRALCCQAAAGSRD